MSAKKRSKIFNPFYPLLVLVGIVFAITACAYGVMTVRGLRPVGSLNGSSESGQRLMDWLDDHGWQLMAVELAALAVATVAAIATDEYWERKKASDVASAKDDNLPASPTPQERTPS